MRMMFKLAAVAVLSVLFQLTIDVGVALSTLPTDACVTHFGQDQSDAVLAAERRFRRCSSVARWIVKDLLAMPIAEPIMTKC